MGCRKYGQMLSTYKSLIEPLLTPIALRGVTIRNRFVMAPMTRCFCPGGIPGEDVAGYYRRRAEGEAGLVITEAIGPDHPAALGDTGLGEKDLPAFIGPRAVEGWRKVVDEVHLSGGKIIPQLWHQGPMKMPDSPPRPEIPAFAPSGYYGDKEKAAEYYRDKAEKLSRPLPVPTDEDIADVIESFGRAADQAREAGFDGIALHGGHGYLIDSFLWKETNQRTDRWGGNAGARTRFAVELVKRCRQAMGDDKPVIFRFSQWKQQDFRAKLAETPEELEAILGPISDAGVDLFDASVRYFDSPAFKGSDLTLAGWAKKLTGKRSGAVGGIGFNKGMYDTMANETTSGTNNLPLVMKRFEAGEFDVVSVGRALLHDPYWVRKARLGETLPAFDPKSLTYLT
jgi:2,4-dienoyl-CoA reductase-like NADH-dependent reductase (Old Yellow Enzyme family)